MSTPHKPPTARERARIEFTAEIKAVARRQLAESGAAALSLRAVARELGLASASALYRYFPGRDALLTALILDGYTSLSDAAEAAHAAPDAEPGAALERWVGVCHAVRDWALAHPHEYALIYGSPVPGYTAPQDTVAQATRLPYLIGALFTDPPGNDGHRPADTRPAMPDDARQSLAPLLAGLPAHTPADLVMSSLMAWTYLLGAISFEVFGHRREIIADPRAFFDHEARRLGAALGLAT
ncbi:TetR/AcrR family transcriptional regulator [Streptomyces sp. ID05-04B]|uniref:TetR/AcrR family transcriptional regulator n=1 Tax=unclassified Streptomyces TaxID=2593676 RepID=UPI000D1A01C5|nr:MULTISPECIES: TetR/AcrR family transcriptional regulator [unclassified Streptomyces]AVV45796.1 TetR family transcriptional regulator [Streptomyces sp. P3]MDX5566383.1 TetR/AcrR family transcriptional regulator [Streptomyces sp. ID05-04B]